MTLTSPLDIPVSPMRGKILVAAAVEIGYAVFTRTWLREHAEGLELELLTSALRAFTAGIYWYLFRDLIATRTPSPGSLLHPLVFASVVSVLAIPILFQGWSPGGGIGTTMTFVFTSFIVGFREELLYRAVLINLLQPKIGILGTVITSTALFIVYHYGVWSVSWITVVEIASMSVILGLMYAFSGSLLAVVLLHSMYDAIWFFGPFLNEPLSDVWRPAFLGVGIVFLSLWTLYRHNLSSKVSSSGAL